MRPSAGVVAALVVGSAFLGVVDLAGQPGPRDKWVQDRTENFLVYSSAARPKTREVIESLEHLRQVMARFGASGDDLERAPITFIFFRNQKAFVPYMRTPPTPGTVRSWDSHFGEGRDYLLVDGSQPPNEMLPKAYEAYAGYLINLNYRELPYWLQVGMGRFYGAAEIEPGRTVRIGMPVERYVRRIREYSMLPLEQFFRVEHDSPYLDNVDNLRTFNAQSWLITHYLLTGGGGDAERSRATFNAMRGGVSTEEAIRANLGMDLDRFERTLTAYARERTLPVFTLEENFLVEQEVPLEEMSTEEISYELGLYLTSAHRPPPVALVEAHLEPLTTEGSPWRADALAVLAQLRVETGRLDEARSLFAQATDLGPQEATSYYRYASFLEEHGGGEADVATTRECLQKAVELEPGFGEAWALLASSYGTAEPAEALGYMEQAVTLLPDRPDLAYNLAMMHLRNHDIDSARTVANSYLRGEPSWYEQALEVIDRNALVEKTNAANQAGDLETALELYRELFEATTDPGERARLQIEIEQYEKAIARKAQIDLYNRAIELANARDYAGASEVLRELLPSVTEVDLRVQIEQMLEQLAALE